jgi:DNA-binding NarL/FixJ family response regulator
MRRVSVLQITPSERAALQMLADGQATRDIASRLRVSEHELDSRLANLFARMGAADRAGAVADAVRRGLAATPAALQFTTLQ